MRVRSRVGSIDSVLASYEVWLGPNRIAVREAGSGLLALVEYLHGEGVPDADIVRLGQTEVSWRGAVYRAVAASAAEPAQRPREHAASRSR